MANQAFELTQSTSVAADHVAAEAIGGEHLGARYYRSPRFVGTVTGFCLQLTAYYAGFVMPVTILTHINADLGPDPNYVWVSLIWTICVSIGYLLNGRFSDMFGRRYFVLAANFLGLLGGIIAAVAKDIPTLIGANVLIGLGASVQISFVTLMGELVPVKDRGYWLGVILTASIPTQMFGPFFSHALVYARNWRWCYYIFIIIDGVGLIILTASYFPPDFERLHTRRTKLQLIRNLDYFGVFLYVAGVVLFLSGVSWGGVVYPWKSAAVLAALILGLVLLFAFGFWETKATEALVPPSIFATNKRLFLAPLLTGVGGGMFYYGLNIIWPYQITAVFRTSSLLEQGWMASVLNCGSALGAILAAVLFTVVGHHRLQLIVLYAITMIFCGVMTVSDATKKNTAIASAFVMGFGVGAIETIVVIIVTVSKDVGNIGLTIGSVGASRSLAGSIAQAVYVTILSNELTKQIPKYVTRSALATGLPQSSLPGLFKALAAETSAALNAVPGMTQEIALAVDAAQVTAYNESFKYVYYASIAFAGASLVCALFVIPDVNQYMSSFVARRLAGVPTDNLADKDTETAKYVGPPQHTETISTDVTQRVNGL